jgi:hypothetical protein
MSQVKTDDTGLHSTDCDCARCDAGYRPTELERSAARRALAIRRADEARRAAIEEPKRSRPRLEPPRKVDPPTPEQWIELERIRRELFK